MWGGGGVNINTIYHAIFNCLSLLSTLYKGSTMEIIDRSASWELEEIQKPLKNVKLK